MRYRRLDPASGDMMFGAGQGDFWRDQPEAVAQLVLTRLMLWQGRWFADLSAGTPWDTDVLGERTRATRDVVIRTQVTETDGVEALLQYASYTDPDTRDWSAAMIISTVYGTVMLTAPKLLGTVPDLPAPPQPPIETRAATSLGIIGSADTHERWPE